MSLSSLLLPSRGNVDAELDVLFKSKPTANNKDTTTSTPASGPSKHVKKRKLEPEMGAAVVSEPKRVKSTTTKPKKGSGTTLAATPPQGDKEHARRKGKKKQVEELNEQEENPDVENAYIDAEQPNQPDALRDSEGDEGQSDTERHLLVHESLRKDKKLSRSGAKTKFVPSDETAERRDQRTIFVGNLSVEVAQKRPLLKQLQRHILAQIPTAKIESTRFRSIPFQTPTSKLPTSDDEETPSKSKSSKQGRAHDRERTSTWREHQDGGKEKEDDAGKNDEKNYLNPKQKKKIAFINQEFHSSADTVHAYIVFAHPLPPESRPSNLPPPSPSMDPYEAARLAAERCDGTSFMDRMIRVDLINKKVLGQQEKVPIRSSIVLDTDPKMSVFVGNLDFASKEEDLRVFFEGVVSAERGPPDTGREDEDEGSKKPMTWVSRVRIVRDKDTQLGKGFAYVQFTDRGCVDEVLALDQSKLKFAKRKLRVQRCKTLPGSSTSTRHITTDAKPTKGSRDPNTNATIKGPVSVPVPIIVPKGDPTLGKKLAHMPKEERKQFKSADADRVARRLAKKKARFALGNKGVKPLGKERERVRKDKGVGVEKGKAKGAVSKKESKGRVRSEKSLSKRNMKK